MRESMEAGAVGAVPTPHSESIVATHRSHSIPTLPSSASDGVSSRPNSLSSSRQRPTTSAAGTPLPGTAEARAR